MSKRPPLPPFTHETATLKARLAEDAWNSRDPEKVALAYTPDSRWRNRSEFFNGRQEIVAFLRRKWARLPADQRAMDLRWLSHRCPVCLRVARRFRKLVPLVWQRKLGIRRGWSDALAPG